MLSMLNLKRSDAHDHEDLLVARVEQELSKLAHDAASHASDQPHRMEADVAAAQPVPTLDAFRPATVDSVRLPDLTQTDAHADPHDFVPVALAVGEPASPANDTAPHPLDPLRGPLLRMASDFSASRPIAAVDTAFRPAVADTIQIAGDRPMPRGGLGRAFAGFVLALVGVAATFVWQSYGDTAERLMARWAPQAVLTAWQPLKTIGLPAQPSPPPVAAATANTAPAQPLALPPAPAAQTAPQDIAPTAAALSPEITQQLQAMAHDLATVAQGLAQLKASQDQMARDIAKLAEQDMRRKVSAALPRPAAAPARKPVATLPPRPVAMPQAAAPQQAAPLPQPAAQPQAVPQASSMPRPPMPLETMPPVH
jgi:hypothetical protein